MTKLNTYTFKAYLKMSANNINKLEQLIRNNFFSVEASSSESARTLISSYFYMMQVDSKSFDFIELNNDDVYAFEVDTYHDNTHSNLINSFARELTSESRKMIVRQSLFDAIDFFHNKEEKDFTFNLFAKNNERYTKEINADRYKIDLLSAESFEILACNREDAEVRLDHEMKIIGLEDYEELFDLEITKCNKGNGIKKNYINNIEFVSEDENYKENEINEFIEFHYNKIDKEFNELLFNVCPKKINEIKLTEELINFKARAKQLLLK